MFSLGDFNIDFLKLSLILTAEFLNNQYSHFVYPLIPKLTKVTSSSVNLIDFLLNIFYHLDGDVLCSVLFTLTFPIIFLFFISL